MRKQTVAFYVAPNGDDANPGTREQPFATLDRARRAVRTCNQDMDRDLVIQLRGGTYEIAETVTFTPADSGTNGYDVIYTNYPGESPVLSGGRRIEGWQPHSDTIYRADIGPGWTFHQLFEDGIRQRKARYPNEGYLYVEDEVEAAPRSQFICAEGDLPDARTWQGGQVYIWAGADWFSNVLPIQTVDRERRIISLEGQTLQQIGRRPERRYFIQGVRDCLDQPGEFWLDTETGHLLYWPNHADIEAHPILAPAVTRIVALAGTSPTEPVEHIQFQGLRFTISAFGDRFIETEGTHGSTPWNEPANKEAAVYLEHAAHCAVRFCEIDNAGYSGICLNGYAQHNLIYGNLIHDCGFHGILLSGYRAAFGTSADHNKHNIVDNNLLHHCGRLVGHGAGIFIWASGHNQIVHNQITAMPRYGICMKGQRWGGAYGQQIGNETVTAENHWDFVHSRENVIAYNHIYEVNQDTEDSGFLSFWGTGKGNLLEGNLLHTCRRELGGLSMGIYLDDAADYFTVRHNIIYDIGGGDPGRCFPIYAKGIHNQIVNNILIGHACTGSAIRSFSMAGERTDHHVYRCNVIVLSSAGSSIYGFQNWSDDRVTESDRNCFYHPEGVYRMDGIPGVDTYDHWRALFDGRFDQHSITADPGFLDAKRHDYRPSPDSPLWALGFEPIDIDKIGLRDDHPFASIADSDDQENSCQSPTCSGS